MEGPIKDDLMDVACNQSRVGAQVKQDRINAGFPYTTAFQRSLRPARMAASTGRTAASGSNSEGPARADSDKCCAMHISTLRAESV